MLINWEKKANPTKAIAMTMKVKIKAQIVLENITETGYVEVYYILQVNLIEICSLKRLILDTGGND